MRKHYICLLSFLFYSFIGNLFIISICHSAYATDILVITNSSSQIDQLSRNEIRQIFLGGTLSRKYNPISLSVNNESRSLFNTKILGLTEDRIQSYWAQLLFSGKRENPPKEFANTTKMIHYLSEHQNTIGYISEEITLPKHIKIIYRK